MIPILCEAAPKKFCRDFTVRSLRSGIKGLSFQRSTDLSVSICTAVATTGGTPATHCVVHLWFIISWVYLTPPLQTAIKRIFIKKWYDLALEIDLTSRTELDAYEALEVPELWIYADGKLKINLLRTYAKYLSNSDSSVSSAPLRFDSSVF